MTHLKSVLIPSNDPAFLPVVAEAYSASGYNVFYGKANLYSDYCRPSVVHILWPEEFTDNLFEANEADVRRLRSAIAAKKARGARVIHSCNNLTPHAQLSQGQRNAIERLFSEVIELSDLIHYFSEHSRVEYERKYPNAAHKKSVVTTGFNYNHLKPRASSSEEHYSKNGAKNFLIFGAIRNSREFDLIRKAWAIAKDRDTKLLLTARYFPFYNGGLMRRLINRYSFKLFLKKNQIEWDSRFINDSEIQSIMDRTDALIVLRDSSLSSGLPLLGMTFGKLIVAPALPTIAEYLRGTTNITYEPGSCSSLAKAICTAKNVDLINVAQQNRRVSCSFDLAELKAEIAKVEVA